jgi:PAS domain S-box-containing protein
LKTKSKYLSLGTLSLIIVIVIVQVADGFSGILILPLSRFVYYGLTLGSEIPLISQLVFLGSMFLVIASLLKYSITGKLFHSALYVKLLQPVDGSSVVYLALGSRKNASLNKSYPEIDQIKKQNTDEGIVMISSGCVVFANKAFFKITGYKPLDVFGIDFTTLIHPDSLINYTMLCRMTAEEVRQARGIAIKTNNNKSIVACLNTKDINSFDPEGVNIFYCRQADDTAKSVFSYSSMLLDSIENVDTLHWIWDEKGTIYLNKSCRNILPFPLGKIISKPGLLLGSVKREDRNLIRLALQEYALTGKFNKDICCTLKNGEEKYFRVNITSQQVDASNLKRNHATACDITNEKRSLQSAETAATIAESANKNKTAFLANMSHEIRSPLNGIIGFSELLADKNLTDAERARYLHIIQNNGTALISLLSDMIDISKLESGKLVIANRKFNPAQLMDELKYQFGSSGKGSDSNVVINFTNCDKFKNAEIESDPNRLRQVLVNLITNAIKFTTKGRIEIGADFSGENMLFWVKDSGIGIPYENQQSIFERFRQMESPDSRPVLGFGLGLAISRALVELLGGKLWVESIPDIGSLFVFTIKTNIVNNTMETTQMNNSAFPYDFKERTILIAEDIDFSFLYIEAVLRRTGVKILWAQNGKEAIEHVKTNFDIDLILMDMQMPVMNGYEATEIISKFRPGLPIIAQTAFVLPEDVKKCYAAGCTGYLAKPIRKEQLMNTLAEYFEKLESNVDEKPLYRMKIG